MQKKRNSGIKCAICNNNETLEHMDKICLVCFLRNESKIPDYIPFEQHDLWIINNNERTTNDRE